MLDVSRKEKKKQKRDMKKKVKEKKGEKKEKFKSKECAQCGENRSIGENEGKWAKKMRYAHNIYFYICSTSFIDSL